MNDQQPTVPPLTIDQFAEIMRDVSGPLVLYARQLCTHPEDVVQEALLRLIAECERPANPRAWLFRVVRHVALNHSRGELRRRKYEECFSQEKQAWFEPSVTHDVEVHEVMDALQRLPDDERETIVARLWGNLNLEEIAALTETSLSTAQRRYVRGLAKLRRVFDADPQKTYRLHRGAL